MGIDKKIVLCVILLSAYALSKCPEVLSFNSLNFLKSTGNTCEQLNSCIAGFRYKQHASFFIGKNIDVIFWNDSIAFFSIDAPDKIYKKKGKLIRERIDRQFCIDSDGLHVVKIQWENAE